jgi:hypothetical protein
MDLNQLLYLFIQSFDDIKKNMNWDLNKKFESRARIHKHRASLIIDSRNIIHHQLPGKIVSEEMKISVIVNVLLFIESLKPQFDNDNSKDREIYYRCEEYLGKLLNCNSVGNNEVEESDKIEKIEQEIKAMNENFTKIINMQTNQIMKLILEQKADENKVVEIKNIKEDAINTSGLAWFNSIDANTWFRYSHIAKENNLFSDKARAFLYRLGMCKANEWKVTEKMITWAKDLYEKMKKYDSDKDTQNNNQKVILIKKKAENKSDTSFADDIPF